MTIDRHSKFLGAMIGSALGDAIGNLANRIPEREYLIDEINSTDALHYTEATVMSMAIAEMLVVLQDIDGQRLGNTFREHYLAEPWRGYGEGPRKIFELVKQEGIGFHDAAARLHDGAGSWGCGAAAHILPAALFYHREEDLYQHIQEVAIITHSNPIAIDGAVILARAEIKGIHMNVHRPFSLAVIIERLSSLSRVAALRSKLRLIPELIEQEVDTRDAAKSLGIGLGAHESVPFALYNFLRHPHTFMECVLNATLHGGSRSSLGAMAGAMAGAYLGIEGIPDDWRQRLEGNQHIETLARELAARCGE